jgi:gamma-resorcylate decarboxylase
MPKPPCGRLSHEEDVLRHRRRDLPPSDSDQLNSWPPSPTSLSKRHERDRTMQGKITVEEHFAIPETLGDSRGMWTEETWTELRARILDMHDRRLHEMDQHGVEMMVLSLNAPAVQSLPVIAEANDIARRANDYLAEQVRKRPDRFQGLAALPMQDPELASSELTRCVNELGFKGALVNGFSQVRDPEVVSYYDTPDYWPFWETVERLGVPFYLHPRNPLKRDAGIYEGHAWLYGPRWAFGQEAAVHALRLIGSGLFDRFPALTIVLGHLGEGLPPSGGSTMSTAGWRTGRITRPANRSPIICIPISIWRLQVSSGPKPCLPR